MSTPFDRFCYWINERESIRLKRAAGELPPWTDDVALRCYRFCNVVRAEDRVSQELFAWYRDMEMVIFNMAIPVIALARFFNRPEILRQLPKEQVIGFHKQRLKQHLRRLKKEGNRLFNPAYMVRGNDGEDKVASVINYTIAPLVNSPIIIDTDSMEQTWLNLKPRYGFGSFMAGQVVADLRQIMPGRWLDAKTWAPLGPGSLKGMNLILGRPLKAPMKQAAFVKNLRLLIKQCKPCIPDVLFNRMDAMDWQNCLCEVSKYIKVLDGGRAKQRYAGG